MSDSGSMAVFKVPYAGSPPRVSTSIPDYVTRLAVADLMDGLYERCGIKREGAEHTLGGFDAWLSWTDQQRALDRWADDGGRA